MAIQCPLAPAAIEKLQKELDALAKLRDDMLREFEGALSKDFQAITEGEKDPKLRGTAVKLAFAKNRLNKKIELKTKEMNELNKEFCKFCAPEKKATDKIALFCDYCEDRSRCPEDQ